MDEEKMLAEVYQAGIRTGIRRRVGSQITEMFRRLWTYERDLFLKTDLQLIAASECWPFFSGACKIGKAAKAEKDQKDAALSVFNYIKELANRQGDRSAYYLAMAVQEPWFEIEGQGRIVAKKQYKIVREAVRAKTPEQEQKFWKSMVAAAKGKGVILTIIQNAGKTALLSGKRWDKILCASVAALALTEPKIAAPKKATGVITFQRAHELTWNSVYPDSTLGQQAYSRTAQRLKEDKNKVRLSWLGCYCDRDVSARDSFWASAYTRQLQGHINNEKWHLMAVSLMSFCQEWFRKNDLHRLEPPKDTLARRDF